MRFFILQGLRFGSYVLIWIPNMMIYWGDHLAWYLLGKQRHARFIRQGQCRNTGVCCRAIGIDYPRSWIKQSWFLGLLRRYYSWVYNFRFLGLYEARRLVFECQHLTPQNTCSIHPFRPKICREYPQVTLTGHARVHRGCGFWFEERGKTSFHRLYEQKKSSS